MHAEHVLMTPELATKILAKNSQVAPSAASLTVEQRRKKVRRIQQYGEDMRAGKWLETGETIKVADDGTLLDGQHRLSACVEFNTSFPTWVMRGVPKNSFKAIDTGVSRTYGDILTIAGEKNTYILGAVLTGIEAYMRGKVEPIMANSTRITPQRRVELLAEFPEARESVSFTHPFGGARTPVSLLHFFGTKIDKEGTEDFLDKLRNGVGLESGSPVLLYREYLFNKTVGIRAGVKATSGYRFALGVKALNDHFQGVLTRKQMAWRFPSEDFPKLVGCKMFGSRNT